MTDFISRFEEAGWESFQQAVFHLERTPAYEEWHVQSQAAYEELEKQLKERSTLFLELEALENRHVVLESEAAYRQGFIDCMALLKWMRALE